MHFNQGRKRRILTGAQLWMFVVGFGYVVAGWMRWPDEHKQKTLDLAWNAVASCIPW